LVRRHGIKPGETKDFDVRNLSQFVETAETSSRILALLLAAVASISLVVGGIGIMNILRNYSPPFWEILLDTVTAESPTGEG
jgi:macrolide transport system ATP-binding/permease protein